MAKIDESIEERMRALIHAADDNIIREKEQLLESLINDFPILEGHKDALKSKYLKPINKKEIVLTHFTVDGEDYYYDKMKSIINSEGVLVGIVKKVMDDGTPECSFFEDSNLLVNSQEEQNINYII